MAIGHWWGDDELMVVSRWQLLWALLDGGRHRLRMHGLRGHASSLGRGSRDDVEACRIATGYFSLALEMEKT
jgi:hypothetical protein